MEERQNWAAAGRGEAGILSAQARAALAIRRYDNLPPEAEILARRDALPPAVIKELRSLFHSDLVGGVPTNKEPFYPALQE